MTNKEIIFNNLSFGNLIFAKRLHDTSKLESGHKTGPFLVLSRKDGHLICLYATSKEKKSSLIKISKNNYNLKKDTYITSIIKFISIDQFIASIYQLTEKEIKNLLKVLYMKDLGTYTSFTEPALEIGDIIQLKQLHLVIGETADNYIITKIEYNSSHKTYEFNYRHKNLLPKNQKYKRVDFLSDEEINKHIVEYQFNKSGNFDKKTPNLVISPLKIGNLVIYKNLLYYLYYEIGEKKLSFSVSRDQTPTSQKITIDGKVYYANFGAKHDFLKNQENIHLVSTATEEEKQAINKKRRKIF